MTEGASNLLLKLSRRLFAAEGDRAAFVDALVHPRPYPGTILWVQPRPDPVPFAVVPPLPWQPPWCDRLALGERPGQHPLHTAGAYYCLDTASVFAAAVFSAIPNRVDTVLDLCAAPGGKSLLVRQRFHPAHLWCNEVIRKRVKILIANLKRCGAAEALVFNLDPQVFAAALPHSADLVVVDAPCSGQSLLAKGDTALGCFHPLNINKNASRQKRILAAAAQTVVGDGHLAYMTCTFSPAENEQVGDWLLKKFPQFEAVPVPALADHASSLADFPCYRLWPQSGLGAGGFTALFRQRGNAAAAINPDFLATRGMTIRPAQSPPNDHGYP